MGRLTKLLRQSSELVAVALSPGGPGALCRWRPMSLSAFRIVTAVATAGVEPRTVLDIGANAGQFARAAVGQWPAASVIAFEPLPGACARLRTVLRGDGHEIHEIALGAVDGTIAFHPHRYDLASSVLSATASARARFPWAEELPPVHVPCRRLDSILAGRQLAAPVLMKIDVQGFEQQVLTGGPNTLRQADILIVEEAFDQYYDGQAHPADLIASASEHGLTFDRVADVRREGSLIVEADMMYRRVR